MLLTGIIYLMVHIYSYYYRYNYTYNYNYSFICYLIAQVISFCQINYCFLMSSEISKECREY